MKFKTWILALALLLVRMNRTPIRLGYLCVPPMMALSSWLCIRIGSKMEVHGLLLENSLTAMAHQKLPCFRSINNLQETRKRLLVLTLQMEIL